MTESKRGSSSSMARGMTNTYILVAGCILMIIGLTQYFTISSENSKLTITVQELQKAVKNSADRIKGLEDNSNAITRERDTCQKDKSVLEQEKAKLGKEVADSKSTNENSKTQINELQNEIDNLNQKLREAEIFQKDATSLEENAKLQVDEAEKQKLLAEEKLQECITREEKVFDDLQKLKSLEKNAPGNKNAKNLNVEDSENAKEKEVIDPMVTPASAKKSNKEKEPKQTKPPKIHFEDGEGVKGKDDEPIDNEESENVDVDENKEEKVDDTEKEDNQDYAYHTEEKQGDEEQEEMEDDPELMKNAQLPDVDPAKIKVEKKDMSANLDQNAENDDDNLPDHPDAVENTF